MAEQHTLTMSKQELAPIVAMMPSPGMGHLIPMIEFAKRLFNHHNLSVTFLIPTFTPPSTAQTTVLSSLPRAISHTFLPQVDLPLLAQTETLTSETVLRSLPCLRRTLLSLSTTHRVTALVVDFFGTDAFDLARQLNVPPYVFFPSTAMLLSFALYLPRLHKEVQCEFRDLAEPVHIPGCGPVHVTDMGEAFHDRNSDSYKCILHHSNNYTLAEGFIENSFPELEPETFKFLLKEEPGRPPVYPVGPLVNNEDARTGNDKNVKVCACLKWLDAQPRGSVIFVCFGSGGTLSSAQINELALGLEMSEQRFLWVVKSPNDQIPNAPYFTDDADTCAPAHTFDFLPNGFVERTKGRGLVVLSWAPQAQVLRHSSIGGFVSHCGWNSILESVVNGVPLVAWPLYAEQKMNAVVMTQVVNVALRAMANENGLVERDEIASVLKKVMEGEEGKKLKCRMKELKEAAATAQSENGSSTKNISQLALKWKPQANMSI